MATNVKVTKNTVETVEAGDLLVRLHRMDDEYPSTVDVVWTQPDGGKLVMAVPAEVLERAAKLVHERADRYRDLLCVIHGYVERKASGGYGCSVCEREEPQASAEPDLAF